MKKIFDAERDDDNDDNDDDNDDNNDLLEKLNVKYSNQMEHSSKFKSFSNSYLPGIVHT